MLRMKYLKKNYKLYISYFMLLNIVNINYAYFEYFYLCIEYLDHIL